MKFYLTDVFGSDKYTGNQLATFVDGSALSPHDMQRIAREINFSETTFIMSDRPVDGGYDVRIFTPREEIEFAGHPTLGTAHVIREQIIGSPVDEVVLNLKVGKIPVRFSRRDDGRSVLWMRQIPPTFGATLEAARVAQVLGLSAEDMDGRWPILETSTGFPHIIVPLTTLDALKKISIDTHAHDALVRGAWAKILLAFAPQPYRTDQRLAVRVFAPYFGISEDAATGSGNGALAAFLVRNRYFGSDDIDIAVGQGYEMGRPSTLLLRARLVSGTIDVSVGGEVIDIAHGTWG